MSIFSGVIDHTIDVFGRNINAQIYTLADLINRYEIDPFEYTTTVDGAAHGSVAHVPTESAIRLSSDGNAAAVARIQTKENYRYQAGKGLSFFGTAIHSNAGLVGQQRRWGFFDDNDGVYFELDGTTLYAVIRSSTSGAVVNTRIPQSSWNIDKLNGTGQSGMTIDVTKGNIYEVRLQWLGVGVVQFWINGFCVHIVQNPNTLTVPYMRSAQLPVRYEIVQTGATAATGTFTFICATVLVIGGADAPEFAFAYSMPVAITCTTAAPDTFLFALRLAATYNAISNRMISIPSFLSFSAEVQRGAIGLFWNPTLTAPLVTTIPDSYSGSEIITGVAAIAAFGTQILRPFLAVNEGINLDLSAIFARNARRLRQGDTLLVVGRGEAGANSDIRGTLVWREVR